MVETCERIGDDLERLGTLTHTDNLAGLHTERSDIDNFTIYYDMLVADQLTGSSTSRSYAKAIYHIVETALERLKQQLTGNAAGCSRLLEQIAELLLQYTVCIFCLLLFSQHDTVLGGFAATGVAVLSGRIIALGKNFIRSKDSFSELTCNARLGSCISSHIFFLLK